MGVGSRVEANPTYAALTTPRNCRVQKGPCPVAATKGGGPGAGSQQPAERAVAGERVTAGPGDEHGRAVEAIHQQCPQRLTCLRSLTTEYSPHIVGARAQLTGHAVAIDRNDRGRLRQRGKLLFNVCATAVSTNSASSARIIASSTVSSRTACGRCRLFGQMAGPRFQLWTQP